MARLMALVSNRPDLASHVVLAEREALRARGRGAPLGWGLGFYQGDEVLIRRRPCEEGPEVDLAAQASQVRADLLVGQVRAATHGGLRTENTHPFRFRQWLFAQTGAIPAFDAARERLVDALPAFLRGQVQGETDAEVFFFLMLSFLHDRGALEPGAGRARAPSMVRDALVETLAMVDGVVSEVGAPRASLNCVVATGSYVVALSAGAPMAYRVFAGRADVEALARDDDALRRSPELESARCVLLASDFDDEWSLAASSPVAEPRWKSAPERAILVLSRGEKPEIHKM
ncbi:MAG: class II glutamine amidotransferase [Myxococcales bacterium]|jgi:glutamine amidotransferase|nr:class II glutamine amidotransferase [Myxococcales bacterium]MBL0193472.1 class II glutamine amidotransferase [Myxococcales bacterium]HQY64433.1 class II glutamine amidotransferase [Polyangiaceae bacterium]